MSYVEEFFRDLSRAIELVRCTGPYGEVLSREQAYERTLNTCMQAVDRGSRHMFIGNGGSAAIASHMAIDFSKNGEMPGICFNDGAALTCLGNDYGYEEVFARQIAFHARQDDVLFAISSSGESPNILRAVEAALERGCHVITFSGFSFDNRLRALGEVNFHVAVNDYGVVEVAHTALIHAVVEMKRAITRLELSLGGPLGEK